MSSPIDKSSSHSPLHDYKGYTEIEGQWYEWTYHDPSLSASITHKIKKQEIDDRIGEIIGNFFQTHQDLKNRPSTISAIKGVWYQDPSLSEEVALEGYNFGLPSTKGEQKQEIKAFMDEVQDVFKSHVAPDSSQSFSKAKRASMVAPKQAEPKSKKILQGRLQPLRHQPSLEEKRLKSAIRTHHKEKLSLQKEVRKLQNDLLEAAQTTGSLRVSLQAKNEEIAALRGQLSENSHQIGHLRQSIAAQTEALRQQSAASAHQMGSLESVQEDLRRQLGIVLGQKEALESEVILANRSKDELTQGFAAIESSLKREITALKASRSQLRINSRKIGPLTKQIASLNKDLLLLRKNNDRLQQQNAFLIGENQALRGHFARQSDQIEGLRRELFLSEGRNRAFDAALRDSQSHIRHLEGEKATLITSNTQATQRLQSQIEGLQNQIRVIEDRNQSLETTAAQIEPLRLELATKEEQLAELQTAFRSQLSQKDEQLAALETQIGSLSSRLEASGRSEQGLRKEISRLRSEQLQADAQKAASLERVSTLEAEKVTYTKELEKLRVELREKQDQIASIGSQRDQLLSGASQTARVHETALRTIDELRLQNRDLAAQLGQSQASNHLLTEENTKFKAALSSITHEKQQIEGQLGLIQASLRSSQEENKDLKAKLSAASIQLGELEGKLSVTNSEILPLKSRLQEQMEFYDSLHQENSSTVEALHVAIRDKEQEISSLQTRNRSLEARIETLTEKLSTSNEHTRGLEESLQIAQKDLSEKDQALQTIGILQEENRKCAFLLARSNEDRTRFQEDLISTHLTLQEVQHQLSDLMQTNVGNESEISRLQQLKTESEQKIAHLESIIEGQTPLIDRLEKEITQIGKERDQALKAQKLIFDQEIMRLSSQLAIEESEKGILTGRIQELLSVTQVIDEQKRQLRISDEAFEALNTQLSGLKAEQRISQVTFSQREQQLLGEIESKDKVIKELQDQFAVMQQAFDITQTQASSRELAFTRSRLEFEELSKKLAKQSEDIDILQQELSTRPSIETIRALEEDLRSHKQQITDLQQSNESLGLQNTTLTQELTLKKALNESQTKEITALRVELEEKTLLLQSQTSQHTEGLSQLEADVAKLKIDLKAKEQAQEESTALEMSLRQQLQTNKSTLRSNQLLLLVFQGQLEKAKYDLETLRLENSEAITHMQTEAFTQQRTLEEALSRLSLENTSTTEKLSKENKVLKDAVIGLARQVLAPSELSSEELSQQPEQFLGKLQGRLQSLTSLNQGLQQQKLVLEESERKLTQELSTVRQDLTTTLESSQTANASNEALEVELETTRQELAKAQSRMERSNAILQEAGSYIDTLMQTLNKSHSPSFAEEMLQEQVDTPSIIRKLQQANLRLNSTQSVIEGLEAQILDRETLLSTYALQGGQIKKESQSLRAEIQSLRSSLDQAQAKERTNQEEITVLRSEISKIERMAKAQKPFIKRQQEETQKQIEALEATIDSLQSKQREHLTIIDELRENLHSQKKEALSLREQLEASESSQYFLEHENEANRKKLQELESNIKQKEQALKAIEENYEILDSDYQSLERRLASKEQTIAHYALENTHLAEELAPQRAEKTLFLQIIEEQIALVADRQSAIDTLNQKVSALIDEKDRATITAYQLQMSAEEKSALYHTMLKTISDIRQSSIPDEKILHQLSEQFRTLSDEQYYQIGALLKGIESLQEKNQLLSGSLEQTLKEHSELQISYEEQNELLELVALKAIESARRVVELEDQQQQLLSSLQTLASKDSFTETYGASLIQTRPFDESDLGKISFSDLTLEEQASFNKAKILQSLSTSEPTPSPNLSLKLQQLKLLLSNPYFQDNPKLSKEDQEYIQYLKVACGLVSYEDLPQTTKSALATDNAVIKKLEDYLKSSEVKNFDEITISLRSFLVAIETSSHASSMTKSLTALKNIRFLDNAIKVLNKSEGRGLNSAELSQLNEQGSRMITEALEKLDRIKSSSS